MKVATQITLLVFSVFLIAGVALAKPSKDDLQKRSEKLLIRIKEYIELIKKQDWVNMEKFCGSFFIHYCHSRDLDVLCDTGIYSANQAIHSSNPKSFKR